MGALHAMNARANLRTNLALVADQDRAAAEALAARCGAQACDVAELIARTDLEGVIVAASSDSLLDLALEARRAGKAVFAEKPLSLSLQRLQATMPEFAAAGPPLFVAFNRRFDPSFSLLRRKLLDGEVGRLESLHLVSHDPAAPSPAFIPRSGGLFRDFTVHDFDTAAWLVDEPFVEICAFGSSMVDPAIGNLGDVDTAKLVLRTKSGRLCMISNSRRSGYGYDQRIEAFGSAGVLKVDNVATSPVVRWGEKGMRGSPIHPAFPNRYAEAYRLEMDHFADILAGEAAPGTGTAEAANALRLAEAAAQSINTGRAVRLPEGEFENA
jgi:myo-inositol 2-dehydrogenase/D-chiro-inositol 1-dehydrogenase